MSETTEQQTTETVPEPAADKAPAMTDSELLATFPSDDDLAQPAADPVEDAFSFEAEARGDEPQPPETSTDASVSESTAEAESGDDVNQDEPSTNESEPPEQPPDAPVSVLTDDAKELGLSAEDVKTLGDERVSEIVARAKSLIGSGVGRVMQAMQARMQQMQAELNAAQQAAPPQPSQPEAPPFKAEDFAEYGEPFQKFAQYMTETVAGLRAQLNQSQAPTAPGAQPGAPVQTPNPPAQPSLTGLTAQNFEDYLRSLPEGYREVFGEGSTTDVAEKHGRESSQVRNRRQLMVTATNYALALRLGDDPVDIRNVYETALNIGFGDIKQKLAAAKQAAAVETRKSQMTRKPAKGGRNGKHLTPDERAEQYAEDFFRSRGL